MDFFPGGELLQHLKERKKFTEDDARFYVAEVILALNHLHKNNVIYRDLKVRILSLTKCLTSLA